MLFLNRKLIGYTALKKSYYTNAGIKRLKKKNSCLIFDSFIIDKSLQKNNLGEILMCFNKSIIYSVNLPTFLICNNKLFNFYKKNDWIYIGNKKTALPDKLKNLNIFSLNLTKKDYLIKKNIKFF